MRDDEPERPINILLIEDNPGDVRLTREAFKEAHIRNELHVVRRGEAALDYLYQRGEYVDVARPDIVLLDLNLPGMNGIEVLDAMKHETGLRSIPVIVLTSSTAEEDILSSYDHYANAYLTKPIDADEFVDIARTIGQFWIRMVELPSAD